MDTCTLSMNHTNNGFREAFDRYDTNKDGVLDGEEIRQVLIHCSEEISDLLRPESPNGENTTNYDNLTEALPTSSQIINTLNSNLPPTSKNYKTHFTYNDFLEMIDKYQTEEYNLRQRFLFFDTDNNGKICKKELKKALKRLKMKYDKKTVNEMIKVADIDGDGYVDYEEFKRILCSF